MTDTPAAEAARTVQEILRIPKDASWTTSRGSTFAVERRAPFAPYPEQA
ncbi:hypothetical protein [Streptomyces lancefieldiae]|uniref:Uncharacterized protein n=1 Tax=Streptomyces lancefieldiae TaxID=3075520 RepID=A0ABU3AIN1_9ACTN|nr:hypothetical protein [Streptomyces sp. DSM 40712]MDT0609854.1 hypothetical protein [Streptomyces sp. DSM 40712]